MRSRHRWFPTRQSGGIGWGLPVEWQGWVVLGVFYVVVAICAVGAGLPHHHLVRLISVAGIVVSIVALFVVCYLTSVPITMKSDSYRWPRDPR